MRKVILMKELSMVFIVVSLLGLGGCAEMMSVTTVDEIHKSAYHLESNSAKSASDVSNCMKEKLLHYTSEKGRASYAAITYRDFETLHDIMLRTGSSTSLAGAEILFLLENSATPTGGTSSHIWVNQSILGNGGSQGYLDRVASVTRICL